MPRQPQRLSVTALAALLAFCSTPVRSDAPPAMGPRVAAVAAEVVDLTNVERNRGGRERLRANPRLMRAAQLQAEQMARSRQLAHVLPKAAYPRIEDRLDAAEYRWQTYGENVALGQTNAAAALESWMHSRGHRANILNPDFTEIGAGHARDEAGRSYWVQVLAAPSS